MDSSQKTSSEKLNISPNSAAKRPTLERAGAEVREELNVFIE